MGCHLIFTDENSGGVEVVRASLWMQFLSFSVLSYTVLGLES